MYRKPKILCPTSNVITTTPRWCRQTHWPEDECNSTQHHVDCNGEEVGQLHVVLHRTHQGSIAVAAVVHDGVVEVTLEKPQHIYYTLENIVSHCHDHPIVQTDESTCIEYQIMKHYNKSRSDVFGHFGAAQQPGNKTLMYYLINLL